VLKAAYYTEVLTGMILTLKKLNQAFGNMKSELIHRIMESQNKIIEWFGLEGTLNLPYHGQGHLPPDHIAQSPVQLGLEPCQGGGSHSFSGQPGPGPHHPQGREFLPCV